MRRRAVLLLTTAMTAALAAGLMASGLASAQTETTFTVNTAADPATPTTTGCDATECTFREALIANNSNNNDTVADTIAFNIPGDGPHTISPTSPLPAIQDPVTIDGYTQGDATAATTDDATENTVDAPGAIDTVLKIELNGSGAGVGQRGVTIGAAANGVVVKGLVSTASLAKAS